jgi:FKBP-type peptidyl-prolyl cis-trans isomerase SlyD
MPLQAHEPTRGDRFTAHVNRPADSRLVVAALNAFVLDGGMPELVAADKVVSFHYTLRDKDGTVLDSSEKDEPMAYLHGADNIVPGLERAMVDKQVGDKFDVTVAPGDGYGERVDGQAVVPRTSFPSDVELEVGMRLFAEGDDGEGFPIWITALTDDQVSIDPNHPLAGVELHFAVEITAIRAATPDELEHGHPHGPDGHHH